jgi:hypothetical protein
LEEAQYALLKAKLSGKEKSRMEVAHEGPNAAMPEPFYSHDTKEAY